MALGFVRLGDGGQPALQGTDLAALGSVGQVEQHRLGRGWQSRQALGGAPGAEVGPVSAVGALGVGGPAETGLVLGLVQHGGELKGLLGSLRQHPCLSHRFCRAIILTRSCRLGIFVLPR